MNANELVDEIQKDSLNDALANQLQAIGIVDIQRGHTNLQKIAGSGITIDLVIELWRQLQEILPVVSDADRALNNLERFVNASRNPIATGALFERDPTALPILLRIFSSSQYLSDLLIRDTESYDYLRLTEGQSYPRSILVDDLAVEVSTATESKQVMQILRRFKHREILRIAFGDLIVEHRIVQVTQQVSFVAEAVCEGAFGFVF